MSEIDAVDQNVGNNIRDLRQMSGLSLAELGSAIGVSYQQIQKYERGSNRVSASMLFHIATALDVPVAAFFEGLSSDVDDKVGLCRSDTVAGRAFARIPNAAVRSELLKLMDALRVAG